MSAPAVRPDRLPGDTWAYHSDGHAVRLVRSSTGQAADPDLYEVARSYRTGLEVRVQNADQMSAELHRLLPRLISGLRSLMDDYQLARWVYGQARQQDGTLGTILSAVHAARWMAQAVACTPEPCKDGTMMDDYLEMVDALDAYLLAYRRAHRPTDPCTFLYVSTALTVSIRALAERATKSTTTESS